MRDREELRRRSPLFAAVLAALVPAAVAAAQATAQSWRLTWSDEFNGRAGAPVDARKWTAEVGGKGWGNKELQYYTALRQNAHLDGRGSLAIVARGELVEKELDCWYGPCRYSSARLVTKGKFAQAYGRFEARMKLPRGQGLWPAFWLLGEDVSTMGWPACGEIDIMENIGREPGTVHGTIHGPGYSGAGGIGSNFVLPARARFGDRFHTFAVEWEPGAIRWYVDGTLYATLTPGDIPAGRKWVYDHPFFILLNLAVGGAWPGDPDQTTAFPQVMLVDYVRVYSRVEGRRGRPTKRPAQTGGARRSSLP